MENIAESALDPNAVQNRVPTEIPVNKGNEALTQNTVAGAPELSNQDASEARKGKISLITGVIVAVINLVLGFLKLPFAEFFTLITGISFLIALVLLFIKQYRYVSRRYLLGLFGTLVGLGLISFVVMIVFIAIGK